MVAQANKTLLPLTVLCILLAMGKTHDAPETTPLVRLVQITDTHIGESCNGDLSYEGCKPVRALTDAVAKVNELSPQPTAVLVTGDITSSALMPEFEKANEILSALKAPWFPVIGNHDSWPYTRAADNTFTQTDTPVGDEYFAKTFGERLTEGDKGSAEGGVSVRAWPTASCKNGNFGFQTWHHNFIVEFKALPNLKVLGLDWTARGAALPEPGVGPEAELHDYPCGTLPWLGDQLKGFAKAPEANSTRFFIAQHHPFHNRDVFSPFGRNLIKNFTFDNVQSAKVQQVFEDSFPSDSILGVIAGHMHRWFYGDAWTRFTALDSKWMKVPEWETSACKGWEIDSDFVSAFTIWDFTPSTDGSQAPIMSHVDYLWKSPKGKWMGKLEDDWKNLVKNFFQKKK
jgi:hypothetical protein